MSKLTLISKPMLLFILLAASSAFAQTTVSSLNPGSGPAGASVTISGAGFNVTPANNIVYFGAVRAVVTGATATSLTATVPVGATYKPVTVLNTATGLTGYSSLPFVPAFTNPFGADKPADSYQTGFEYSYGLSNFPGTSTIVDLDTDGKPDLVTGAGLGRVYAFRNTSMLGNISSSSFAAPVLFNAGAANSVAAGDINGDGKPDLVVVSPASDSILILSNTSSSGTITADRVSIPFTMEDANDARFVNLTDLDKDGKLDIIMTYVGRTQEFLLALRNNSVGGVVTSTSFSVQVIGAYPILLQGLNIADLDGDDKPDMLIGTGGTFSVLRNTSAPGSISFAARVNLMLPVSGFNFADIDGDGKLDFLLNSNDTLSVLRNIAIPGSLDRSSFADKVDFPNNAGSLAVSDVTGDGKPDLVYYSFNNLGVLRNTATAGSINASSFAGRINYLISRAISNVTIGDLDGDGVPEIIGAYTQPGPSAVPGLQILKASALQTNIPVISSFSPATGPAGATVTISGSGFNATPAGNIVYFGAVKATVTGGSATSLIVTVPVGATYQPITVLNTATGLTAYSTKPFTSTFANPFGNSTPANFYQPKVDFGTGTLPYTAAISDLDGDGKPDMVTANYNSNTISVLRNTSDAGSISPASFAAKVDLPVQTKPYTMIAGDVNGDGKPDLIALNQHSSTISIFRNISTAGSLSAASFAPRVDVFAGVAVYPISVALGDLDGDGRPDLVTANTLGNTVSVLRNATVSGNFNAFSFLGPVNFAAGNSPRFVAVGDLDGDKKADIVVANEGSNTISVLRNTSITGLINPDSFAPKVDYDAGEHPVSLAIGDLNGDDKPEVVVANYIPFTGEYFSTLTALNNTSSPGSVSFGITQSLFSYGREPFSVAIGDVTGDGLPDIIAANAVSNSLSVLRHKTGVGGSSITFLYEAAVEYPTASYPVFAASGDLNGDGTVEALTVNASGSVSVFKIGTPLPPVVTSFSPASGAPGTLVSINGANFDPDVQNNVVYFGGVRATPEGSGGFADFIAVRVPAGAAYKPFSVLNLNTGLTGYSTYPFITTFTTPFGTTIPANFYQPKVDFTTGALPYSVATGDLNGDGRPEMVTANFNASTISIFTKTSSSGTINTSSFSAKTDLATGVNPYSVVIGDVDGDGRLDIIVANYSSSTISVYRNVQNNVVVNASSFAPRVDFPVGPDSYPFSVAIGDIDGDGRPELAVVNPLGNRVSVLRNVSSAGSINASSFAAKVDFATGTFPRSVAIRDLDGDGKPELVVANQISSTVSVLRNTAVSGSIDASSFAGTVDFAVGSDPFSVVTVDADGDGKLDIATANHGSGTVSVLRNVSGTGSIDAASFAAKVDFSTGSEPFAVAIGDVNGDGRLDLVTANSVANSISVLRNTSAPGIISASSFADKADFATGGYPLWVAASDLDGDGRTEIATSNAANSISILKINLSNAASVSLDATISGASGKAVAGTDAAGRLKTDLRLFPNPTQGSFTLQLFNVTTPVATIEVLNEQGTVIQKRSVNLNGRTALNQVQLNVRNQPSGVYYVKVTSVNGVQLTRFVLQR